MSEKKQPNVRTCRICGCTDDDCHQCIEKTGEPCYWVEDDLCSACAGTLPDFNALFREAQLKKFKTMYTKIREIREDLSI
jgi:hypothetical protein